MSTEALAATVIGDIALIVAVSGLLGALARKCGQPAVVGQIVAGVLLGPSVLGRLPGDPSERLFPAEALPYLSVLSQVVVVLLVFVAGYEMDLGQLRQGRRASVLVAALALLVPMALGMGAAQAFGPLLASMDPGAGTDGLFPLFMGVAMSVTALPVLAAIARERGLAGTVAGTVATAAAGIMDAAAWLVLAAVVAGGGHAPGRTWPGTLALLVLFLAGMLLVVRPALSRLTGSARFLRASQVPLAVALALGCAWATASLGLHAVFGGLIAGMAMPRREGAVDPEVLRSAEQCAAMLLPVFFVTTGLSLDIGALPAEAYALLAVVVLIATAGKLVPAYAGCRLGGLGGRDAAVVAVLVNTRGLTELIVLNVALEAGLIGEDLFTILVIMALLTTLVTGPLLTRVSRLEYVPVAGRTAGAAPGNSTMLDPGTSHGSAALDEASN